MTGEERTEAAEGAAVEPPCMCGHSLRKHQTRGIPEACKRSRCRCRCYQSAGYGTSMHWPYCQDGRCTGCLPPPLLPFSLNDGDALLTMEQRQARDAALNRLAELRGKGPTTNERVL